MPEKRSFLTTIAEFIIGLAFAAILVALFMALLPGCRTVHQQKSSSHQTLDSTTLAGSKDRHVSHQDSTIHQVSQDTGSHHSWWNYERETTTSQEWKYVPQAQLDQDTAHPALAGKAAGTWVPTTTIRIQERGSQEIMETHQNTAGLDVDWSKVDTSTHQQAAQSHVTKTQDSASEDRKVRTIPPTLVVAGVIILSLVVLFLVMDPSAIWSWILAVFRRKSRQDNP